MNKLYFFVILCLFFYSEKCFSGNQACMTKDDVEKEEDCTGIAVDPGWKCCYVEYEMEDDSEEINCAIKKCHAIRWKKKHVSKYAVALEDFDEADLQCSGSALKYSLLIALIAFIF
ncbi:MAG: hypothetical protein MJ252_16255 [archaeon]|nr:hypothetical protein [archaeon]